MPPNRRDIGLVFQTYALFPHIRSPTMSPSACASAVFAAAEVARRVGRMLERVGLHGFADRFSVNLSGGQRQRVAPAGPPSDRPC